MTLETKQQTFSLWQASVPPLHRAPFTGEAEVDVCVVGCGIAGLSTAYLLAREGRSVIAIDSGGIGSGQTGRTTAHLTDVLDDRFSELERMHGEHGARLAAESHSAAINTIEEIVNREQIWCDFTRLDGYLFSLPNDPTGILEAEYDTMRTVRPWGMQWARQAPIPGVNTGTCIRFDRQAQIHPLRYLIGLAEAFERLGGRLHTDTHVLTAKGGAWGTVETSTGAKIKARNVVITTNSPINDRLAIHTKQASDTTYVIAAKIPKGSVVKALYWDTSEPYHYVRLANGEGILPQFEADQFDLLVVGGEDHKTGQADDAQTRYNRLETWARQHFPSMQELVYWWSGQVLEPVDSLAFIGRNTMDAGNVFIATGDSGMGMTHGTIAGILLTDLIIGRKNPWESLYDPGRTNLRSTGEFLKHNLNVARAYGKWLSKGEVKDPAVIQAGSGAVVRRGMKKIACHRDADGNLHEMSAVCSHLGGIVAWNSFEKTWDCPCHGSRYDALGHVIEGPARADLEPLAPPAKEAEGQGIPTEPGKQEEAHPIEH